MTWVVGIAAFLLLLFIFPKPMLGILALAALIIGGLAAYYWYEDKVQAAKEGQVRVSAEYNPDACDDLLGAASTARQDKPFTFQTETPGISPFLLGSNDSQTFDKSLPLPESPSPVMNLGARYPILVTVNNTSPYTVNSTSLRLYAKRPGHSSNVYRDDLNSDRIIPAKTQQVSCWSLDSYYAKDGLVGGVPVATLQWGVEISSVRFAH